MVETQGRITLWAIEVFMAVADEGALSSAARRLGISISGVSQQLSTLEAALGAVLLDRSARPLALTPAGEMFRRRAQIILFEAGQARAEVVAGDLSGLTNFRLGMIEDFDADVTPRLLSDMAEELKSCQFLLETGASHRLFDQLDSRTLDMVVAADLGPPAKWMEVHPLLREPFMVVAPRGAAGGKGDLLAQLSGLPLILYTQRHHMGRLIAEHLARQELRLAHRFELDSYRAIMAMVAGGAGWTILSPLGFSHAQRFHGAVEVLPLPVAPLGRTISLNARAGVLRDLPGQVADRLRPLLRDLVVGPMIARMPWLEGQLQVL